MAYDATGLLMLSGASHTAARFWHYKTEDAIATVRGADYIANAQWMGMKVGDLVHVLIVNGSNVPQSHHMMLVETVDGDGAQLSDGIQLPLTQGTAIASLTDSTTGTADATVANVGASFSQATLNNNFADLTAKVNAILAAMRTAGMIAT